MAAEGGDGVVEQAAGHLLVVHREERENVMVRRRPFVQQQDRCHRENNATQTVLADLLCGRLQKPPFW